jgi:hypothetical protein
MGALAALTRHLRALEPVAGLEASQGHSFDPSAVPTHNWLELQESMKATTRLELRILCEAFPWTSAQAAVLHIASGMTTIAALLTEL